VGRLGMVYAGAAFTAILLAGPSGAADGVPTRVVEYPTVVATAEPPPPTTMAPATPSPAATAVGSSTPTAARMAVVRGERVPVRKLPSREAAVIAMLHEGEAVEVGDGGVRVDGVVWWPVVAPRTGDEGWVRWEFLAGVDPARASALDLPVRVGDGDGKRVDKRVRVRRRTVVTPPPPPTPVPTATPIPTPTPPPDPPRSPATGAVDDPIPVGEYGRFREWTVAVMAVTPDAGPLLRELDPFNEPRSGFQYVLFDVRETNTSGETRPAGSVGYGAQGRFAATYLPVSSSPDPAASACGPLPRPFPAEPFEPGETRDGQVCFEVTEADAPYLRLVAADADDETLWFMR
jgi:hypothetical protein